MTAASPPARRASAHIGLIVVAALISLWLALPNVAAAGSKKTDKDLPKEFQKSPFSLMSLSVGYPNQGWQLRAKRLKKSGDLKILKKSEDNTYGHPALVLMLKRSAKQIAKQKPGSVMVVGDLSSKHGGSLTGHRSHQSGRDADILFYALDKKGRKVVPTKFVSYDGNGNATDGSGLVFDDERNWLLIQLMAKDDRAGLSHIFVSRALRQRLLKFAQGSKAHAKYIPDVQAVLKQPEDSTPHNDHFHVRISCPKKHDGLCHEQSK